MLPIFSKRTQDQSGPEYVGGFFGKIPSRADFVKYQAHNSGVIWMDQWLHEGIAYLARRHPETWKDVLAGFSPVRFYIGGSDTQPSVTGMLSPSRDKSGRYHPLVNFITCKSLSAHELLPELPYCFQSFFDDLDTIYKKEAAAGRYDQWVQAAVRSSQHAFRFSCQPAETCAGSDIWKKWPSKQLWDVVAPDFDNRQRAAFLRDVNQTLKMVANRSPSRTAWGIRFPLGQHVDVAPIISFWSSMVSRIIGDRRQWQPHIFWDSDDCSRDRALTFFFRQPGVSSFIQLIHQASDEGTIVDIRKNPLENMPDVAGSIYSNIAESNDLSLGSLQAQLCDVGAR